jgi:probable HAF family extracellular repeat protein
MCVRDLARFYGNEQSIGRVQKTTVWVVVLGLSISDVSSQTYTVTDLGLLTDIGSQSQSKPNAINNRGNVAAANVVNGAYRAVVYTGTWTNLGTLGGGNSYAAGINDSGRVVGYSLTTGGLDHSFLWTPGGSDGVPGNIQIVISFTSVDAGEYSMQAIEYTTGYWTDVLTGISGRNGILTVTNFGGATFPQRFFRIKQSLP